MQLFVYNDGSIRIISMQILEVIPMAKIVKKTVHHQRAGLIRQQRIGRLLALFCMMAVMVMALSACIRMQKSAYPNTIEVNASFKLAVDQAAYSTTDTEIDFTLYNDSDDEAIFGADYSLEILRNGSWYVVPFKGVNYKTEPTWPAIAYILPAHGNAANVIDLSIHESIKPGEYRLIKPISLRSGEQTRYILAAYFTVK
jgi:hypothetical protein